MAELGQAAVLARIEDIAEALRAQNRMLASMLGSQKVCVEMTAKVLEAVTGTTDAEDDPLGDLLKELVMASREHGEKLQLIFERVCGPGGGE
jgi:hypothetical protein